MPERIRNVQPALGVNTRTGCFPCSQRQEDERHVGKNVEPGIATNDADLSAATRSSLTLISLALSVHHTTPPAMPPQPSSQ